MWREINNKRVFCHFNKEIVFDGIYIKDDSFNILDLSDTIKVLSKDPFNCETTLPLNSPALIYVVREGKINKVNVLVQTKFLDLDNEDFGSLLVSLGMMCGELTLKTQELFEIGKVTYSSGVLYGEGVSMKKVALKEHKLMKNYKKEDLL